MKFLVSQTYSEITPESAEHGDFSDNGYEFEDEIYTLRELIDHIKREGFHREWGCNWFTTGFYTICYREGIEKEQNLHIKLITKETKKF